MAILLFDGCDKTGKSTLFNAVLKETNYHICIDRFTASQYVYGRLHSKSTTPQISKLREIENNLLKSGIPCGFVYVVADVEDIKDRFEFHDEMHIKIQQVPRVLDSYETYMSGTPLPILKLNTSEITIKGCVREILQFANSLENPK
jgi:thymidylate kinase